MRLLWLTSCVPLAAWLAISNPAAAPPAEVQGQTQQAGVQPASKPRLRPGAPPAMDRTLCTCDQIPLSGVGWCPRHHRGYAYGHVLRSWQLTYPLLPDEPYGEEPCQSADASPPQGDTAACLSRPPVVVAHQAELAFLGDDLLPRFINAFPRDSKGGDTYVLTNVPQRCPHCGRYHSNGRTCLSWIPVAMEAGHLLPALRAAAPTAGAADACASQPAGSERADRAANSLPAAGAAAAPLSPNDPVTEPRCEYCAKAFAAGAVWEPHGFPVQDFCEKCGVGVVAGRVFVGREAYELAKAADSALAWNRVHRCEVCGIGVMVGGQCRICSECKSCHAP